jgi:hypothetical protein
METAITSLNAPPADNRSLPSPTASQFPHHRKNHRGGAKEHARRERKASNPNTPAETTSSMSAASSVSETRKKSHRAGVKYKARREAQTLYKMTSAGMVPLEPEEGEDGYDSEGESINGEHPHEYEVDYERHSKPDAPSLTYDSDEHEEDHEELEMPEELFKPGEIQEAVDSKLDFYGGEGTFAYVEKTEAKVEIGTYEEPVDTTAEIGSYEETVEAEEEIGKKQDKEVVRERILDPSPPVVVEEKEVLAPKENVTITPPKKHPIKLLSLMRPKVL